MKTYAMNLAVLTVAWAGPQALAQTQSPDTKYAAMAPFEQYLMAPDAETALARSAAPASVSRNAEVMVLGPQGYRTAAQGSNGFVCIVQRSWAAGTEDPEFWNPRLRAPICFNPAGARSCLPLLFRKTALAIAGSSRERITANLKAAFDRKELPEPEAGAMGYMMSKQALLNDRDRHWHPHVMFYTPLTGPADWGAGLAGAPLFGFDDPSGHVTLYAIPVAHWSDGSADGAHDAMHETATAKETVKESAKESK